MIRTYRFTSTATASAVGQATTTIVANGVIVGVQAIADFAAGAGRGRLTAELALNNTAQSNAEVASGAPSEQLITRIVSAATASATSTVNEFIPVNRRVQQGNQVCINLTAQGTAPNSSLIGFDMFVNE